MLPILLLAAAVAVGLAIFWKDIVAWIQRAIEKIKQVIPGILEGVKTFLVRLKDGLKNIAKYYSKNKITKEYEETVTQKAVNEDQVPAELRAKANVNINMEVDTTNELMAQLAA